MLSKLFHSAKHLFVPPPSTSNYDTSVEGTTRTDPEMVTTRRSKNASQAEDSIVVEMPSSSRKRSRRAVEVQDDSEPEEIEALTKKQRRLPLRERDESGPNRHSRLVVEIPVKSLPVDVRSPVRNSEKGDDDKEEEDMANEEIHKEPVWIEISDSASENEDEDEKAPEPALPTKKSTPLPSSKKSIVSPISAKSKHKRFGSEEPEIQPEFFSTAAEILDSEEESSDDDAPEVVGAQDAMESAQSKARDAAKAVEELDVAVRRKRQERDAALKKQAADAATKRKREAEKAEKELKKAQKASGEFEDAHVDVDVEKGLSIPVISRSNIPDLLPEEYFEDGSDSDELDANESEAAKPRVKKFKLADLAETKPKDRRKGTTTYRVSEVQSKSLAPKSSFHAKSVKESWLHGRAGKGPGGIRKVASTGFFKKK